MSTIGRPSRGKLSSPSAIASASLLIFLPGRSPATLDLQSRLRQGLFFPCNTPLHVVVLYKLYRKQTSFTRIGNMESEYSSTLRTFRVQQRRAHTNTLFHILSCFGRNYRQNLCANLFHIHHAVAAIFRTSTQFFHALSQRA